jgi:hypothetical protein
LHSSSSSSLPLVALPPDQDHPLLLSLPPRPSPPKGKEEKTTTGSSG